MKTLKVIQDDLYILIEYSMKNYGLGNSDVLDEARVSLKDNFFLLMFPDYIEYINSGRKPHSKMPPTKAIVNWCREKGIPTDNNTVWKIRLGIARQGISPRPVLDMIFKLAEKEWNTEWADLIFKDIILDLINWFK